MRFVIFFLGLWSVNLSEGFSQNLFVNGRIKNTNGEPLPYANIFIKNTSLGTVSNEAGEFSLAIQTRSDTLIISYIGYKSKLFLIRDIDLGKDLLINLLEDKRTLNEVTVTSARLLKNPNTILKLAIERLSSTQNKEQYVLKGYYRHVYEQDGEYKQLIEAAISINHNTNYGIKGINVDQIKKSQDLRIIYALSKTDNFATEKQLFENDKTRSSLSLNCWYRNNFISTNQLTTYSDSCTALDFGLLDGNFIKEHKFKLDSLSVFENNYVYVIKILPSNSSKPYYTFPNNLIIPVGRIYVRTDDFFILKMEYQYILNPKKQKLDDFRITYSTFGSGIIFKKTALYKEFNGYQYLSYFNTQNYMSHSLKDRDKRIKENGNVYNLIERTFMVNEIVTDPNEISKSLARGDWDGQLYKDSFIYDHSFWSNYTTLIETDKQVKMRVSLEKEIQIRNDDKK
jgi:hypothetical protein